MAATEDRREVPSAVSLFSFCSCCHKNKKRLRTEYVRRFPPAGRHAPLSEGNVEDFFAHRGSALGARSEPMNAEGYGKRSAMKQYATERNRMQLGLFMPN